MKPLTFFLACAAALVSGAGLLWAVDPAAPATGTVLLLDNDRTLEGDIERVGDQYRVRRGSGETWVSGDRVRSLCADASAAYSYLRGQANLDDADERLRLARWCREHGLPSQALAEVEAAVKLRPKHAGTRALLAHLQQVAKSAPVPTPVGTPPAEPTALPPVDLTGDAVGQFATRVQPVLLNACAGCHGGSRGGSFKLTRGYESAPGHRTTQQNLAAVLAEVNFDEPQVSPLLTKSVSAHGTTAMAPLKDRRTAAYRALEGWVKATVSSNPQLHTHMNAAPSVPPPPPANLSPGGFAESQTAPVEPTARPAMPAAEAATAKPVPPTGQVPATTPPPSPKTEKDDPFDPAVFNRQAHPERTKSPTPKP